MDDAQTVEVAEAQQHLADPPLRLLLVELLHRLHAVEELAAVAALEQQHLEGALHQAADEAHDVRVCNALEEAGLFRDPLQTAVGESGRVNELGNHR
eukprot:2969385-Prymnesium_polylepis.1